MMVLPVACAALLACTPMAWVKPDADPEQVNRDIAQCREAAWREARFHAPLFYRPGPTLVQDPLGRRFLAWPYSPFGDPFGEQFMEESRLLHFCMRAKGYDPVPVEPAKKPA